jgi:hypothetical protein
MMKPSDASKEQKMGNVTLRRYTNLASTIHILKTGSLTLLDPSKWEDQGDAHFMSEYKRQARAKSVLALCFSLSGETFHHWKVFASGGDGICIEFDREALEASLRGTPSLQFRSVEYLAIKEWDERSPGTADLPFVKRLPYEPEKEFRIVYTHGSDEVQSLLIPISHSLITRITISPWMPKPLVNTLIATLKSLSPTPLSVFRSTLLGNQTWMDAATTAHL